MDVVGVDADDSMDEVERVFKESGFSRLPVYEENIDNIIGIIHEKDFYAARGAKSPRDIMHPALYVTPGSKISVLLRMLQKAKNHIAVVKDEYGGTAGIVTMEDIIEELVGEIYDEHDEVVEEFKRLPDGTIVAEGSAELDKLQEQLGIPGEFDATTVGGWVTELLGRIPQVGDSFDLEKPRRRGARARGAADPTPGERGSHRGITKCARRFPVLGGDGRCVFWRRAARPTNPSVAFGDSSPFRRACTMRSCLP